jgi:hypothetical protein
LKNCDIPPATALFYFRLPSFTFSSIPLTASRGNGKFPPMKTLIVDAHKRIRLPDTRPRQVFACENTGDGRLVLTKVKAEPAEPFPPDYDFGITPEFNRELTALAKGSSLRLPE